MVGFFFIQKILSSGFRNMLFRIDVIQGLVIVIHAKQYKKPHGGVCHTRKNVNNFMIKFVVYPILISIFGKQKNKTI